MPTRNFLSELQDWRAERQLVSLISLYPDFWPQARNLRPDNFSNVQAREGWEKIRAAFEAGLQPDPADYIGLHDLAYPPVPLQREAESLVRRVAQADYRLQLVRYAEQLVACVQKGDLESARAILATPPLGIVDEVTLEQAPAIASRLWDQMSETSVSSMQCTGFDPLDRVVGNFESKTLTILMARPGMGKTAALVQAADVASRRGLVTAVFSKEMSSDQWLRRAAARRAEAEVKAVKNKSLSESQAARYADELSGLMERHTLYIDDATPQTTDDVMEKCAALKRRAGRLDFVMADHLRLFADRADNETHRLGKISWGFKRIAKELDTRVIVAAQLSRAVEGQSDRRPDLKDLRDSGEIEENADSVIAMYRDKYYNPQADASVEFLARKSRDGERNLRSICDFAENYMSFEWRVM